MRKENISVTGWAFVGLALLILLLPLKWIVAALLAAVIHELSHFLAVKACGGRLRGFSVGMGGAVMETDPMSPGKELLCILAGPTGGLSLLLLVRWFPRLAVCGAMHSVYNLLPIYPLDGGRAIRCLSHLFLRPDWADGFCDGLETLCKISLLFLAFYATAVRHLGLLPLLVVTLILVKTKKGNSPCKPGAKAVQ